MSGGGLMTLMRIGSLWCCVVFTSVSALAQSRNDTAGQVPFASVIERTSTAGDGGPWQRTQTRTQSAGREVVVETLELPDVDGKLTPVRQTVVESTGATPVAREVFRFTPDRRRELMATTDSRQDPAAAGESRVVHDTSSMDVNGRLVLTSREIARTRSSGPDARQTETTFLVPTLNQRLEEVERVVDNERRTGAGVIEHDGVHLMRDINGRWQPIETRRGDVRDTGPSERLEQETIERPDINGHLAVVERTVVRRFRADGQDHLVVESYAPYASVWPSADRRLVLVERLHRTIRATADGTSTVDEVEGKSLVAPADPMRLIRRSVATERRLGAGRSVTDVAVFERDVNGRMRLVSDTSEERQN